MQSKFKEKRAFFDYRLFFTMLILMAISTVMVYSASVWNGGDYANTSFFEKQLMFDVMAIVVFLFVAHLNHETFRGPLARLGLYLITFGMLTATLFAAPLNGARAWLNFGIFLIQPIELCKFVLVIGLANYFDQKHKGQMNGVIGIVHHFIHRQIAPDSSGKRILLSFTDWILIPMTVLLAPYAIIIRMQPDDGGLFILLLISAMILFAVGLPRGYIAVAIVFASGVGLYAWNNFSANQMERIQAIFNPFLDAEGKGYQLINSVISIAHGGFFGVGLGNSFQKYGYLPEPETDYIMSIISEELGFVGVLVVLGLLFFLMWQGALIARQSASIYSSMVAFGISSIIFIQTGINIGAMSGLFPGTGVTLPFISYGGSSLLVMSTMLGVVANISMQNKHRIAYHKEVQEARKMSVTSSLLKGGASVD
ncbi:cell cycle protein [Exiguobacterium sibiricum 255-15]|uniref:Probable peptidoglycan glycosyltransferase FtsW n=1 Tax=Exiguobacterium sibiricum (strain DSM 17290 / CCUG 55495 / CIP 109462 / JCM 13490 / 255-15) TaxID=262543 RepID=B1YJ64_EXIS2|nr:FtsW/RodA/SpoVE family cell cycle protein [Exiguobacterium sibiricum]ACB61445.1 cell cycle protein [Exiguobacterium sibiricum 255-15]